MLVRGFGSFGNDPREGHATEPYYQFGEPRTVGISASYPFSDPRFAHQPRRAGPAWAAQSGCEMVAVDLALTYLLLVVRQHLWCWVVALISTTIYKVLFWDVSLLMQPALNA